MSGSTLAIWSDSEISFDNFIETGSLELKVDGKDDLGPTLADPLWGQGIGPVLTVTEGHVCVDYDGTVSLWNAGDADGVAYLQIKNLIDPDGLSSVTDTEIWYDDSLLTSGWMSELAWQQIRLGDLLSNETRMVRIVLHTIGGDAGDRLEFDLQFDLVGCWADSEISEASLLQLANPQTGTIGFWGAWESHNTYTQGEVEGWLFTIDSASAWLGPTTTAGMESLIDSGTGGPMEQMFLAHYLAQRLTQESGRQDPALLHDVTPYDPTNYLNLPIPNAASGTEIILAIEAKYGTLPTDAEYETMKDVCDALNNLLN